MVVKVELDYFCCFVELNSVKYRKKMNYFTVNY